MPRVTTDRLKALAHGLGVPAEDLFACALSKTPPAASQRAVSNRSDQCCMGAQRLSNTAVAKKAGVGSDDRLEDSQRIHTGRLLDSQESCRGYRANDG